jgi:hypothetical protein
MAMNTNRVIAGGLAAGVVLNVVDFVSNGFILKDRMTSEMNAVAAGLSDKMMTTPNMVTFIVLDFVLGIMLVWLYAAIRPRFGAGPKTAVYAGLFYWILGAVFYWAWVPLGLMSMTTYELGGVIQLVNVLAAAWVGAMIYKEDATPM